MAGTTPENILSLPEVRTGWSPQSQLEAIGGRRRLAGGLLLSGLCGLICVQWLGQDNSPGPSPALAMASPARLPGGVADLEALARHDHIALLERCLDHYRRSYVDYTCTFTKQERIGGVLGQEQEIAVRFRQSPFSVAMSWVRNPPACDRILYVEGRNGNQMRVRPANRIIQALLPKGLDRKPDGEEAKAATLRTVNQFGFERGMTSLLEVYQAARGQPAGNGELKMQFGGYFRVHGRDTLLLIRYLPVQRKEYPAYRTNIYIDIERLLPVLIEAFDWGTGDLLYRYAYSDVSINVGLPDSSFQPEAIGLKAD